MTKRSKSLSGLCSRPIHASKSPPGTRADNTDRELIVTGGAVRSREVWLAADYSKFNRPAIVELARLAA